MTEQARIPDAIRLSFSLKLNFKSLNFSLKNRFNQNSTLGDLTFNRHADRQTWALLRARWCELYNLCVENPLPFSGQLDFSSFKPNTQCFLPSKSTPNVVP